MQKSNIKTSRKIYAMKSGLSSLALILLIYSLLLTLNYQPSELVFVTAIGGISAIISSLNIADGWKGHEAKVNE